jgi:hypothetical protein
MFLEQPESRAAQIKETGSSRTGLGFTRLGFL